jgi:hypothetical protein
MDDGLHGVFGEGCGITAVAVLLVTPPAVLSLLATKCLHVGFEEFQADHGAVKA